MSAVPAPPPVGALLIMPTYNERASLPATLERIRERYPDLPVLVVDDASPDGTGRWAKERAREDRNLHVLTRSDKDGLGRAYLAGFRWAQRHGYDVVVQMDADGSHRAADLPALFAAWHTGADLVIGSRWVPGGAVRRWARHRAWLSRNANRFVRRWLDLPVRDSTAGFRIYRMSTLQQLDLPTVQSQGYCFQIDLTRRLRDAGGRIVEVPITFVEREQGSSKMSRAIVVEALWRVTVWGATRRLAR